MFRYLFPCEYKYADCENGHKQNKRLHREVSLQTPLNQTSRDEVDNQKVATSTKNYKSGLERGKQYQIY